ncbi:MAG TPA: DUF1329 domain-containing protein [Steroidobacteraceae bacterium]|nr:DUF1329 domain-containing protein [Steroidobacteraceae bacterium]
MTRPKFLACAVAATLLAVAAPASAKLTDVEAARLGTDLTPVGGEKAGNKDGTIPAWTGGLCAPPAGWTPAQGYTDPFPNDKVQFTITKANATQYKDKLTPGTLAMLNKYEAFKMPVYTTRRTACLPQEANDLIKSMATKIDLQGFGYVGGFSYTPFPIPKSGLEAIWNHVTRYLGGGVVRQYNTFPVRANGDYYKITTEERRVFYRNLDQAKDNLLGVFMQRFLGPATLEGTVFLVHEPIDQVREQRSAWIYNSGQRRVRRAPDLSYDNINDGTEGLRTTDQFDAFNGAPDRYDWKLVGKKEIYVPYNAYKLSNKKLKYKDDVVRKNTPNADLMRYELHRAWEVEATLKPNSKHIYAKRVFYLDEDSWNVLYEDVYDTRKQLWRVSIHPAIQYYDAKVPWVRANIWHDLGNGSYLLTNLDNEIRTPWSFGAKAAWGDFQPDALRRLGTK